MARLAKLFPALAALAILVAPAAQAQEQQTVAIVSFTGIDPTMGDVGYVGNLIGMPGLQQQAGGAVGLFTQGIDKTKPWGMVLLTDGQGDFQPLGFIPVTSLEQVMGGPLGQMAPNEKTAGGAYKINPPNSPMPVFAKEQGGWAYLGRSEESLANVPEDPLAMLQGLEKQYDIAVRLNIQSIPKMFRDLALEQLEQGAELGLEREEGESDAQFEARKKIVQIQMDQLKMLVEETQDITIGLTLDATAGNAYFDFAMTAIPGTTLAEQMTAYQNTSSKFAGFLQPDAVLSMNIVEEIKSQEDIEQAVAVLDSAREQAFNAIDEEADLPDDQSRKIVKSSLNDVFDVIIATLKEGKIDGGAFVLLEPESMTCAIGMQVASGSDLEEAIKKIMKLAEEEPGFKGVNWDADQHANVRFHTMTIPIPDADEEARELLGEALDVVIGIGDKSFYLAFGKDSLATVKSAIDQSAADAANPVPPMQLVLSMASIMEFAASQEDDPEVAAVSEQFKQVGDQDHIRMTVKAIENGFVMRMEAESGVIEAFGKAAVQQDAGGGAGEAAPLQDTKPFETE